MTRREETPGVFNDSRSRWGPSRRTMMGGVAATGVVLAADAISASPAAAAAGRGASTRLTGDVPEDLVAHVRDARAGLIDVYVGEWHVQVRDRALAAQLVNAAH